MELPVEDEYADIVGKAQKGLDLSTEELARKADLELDQVRAARRGDFDPDVAAALAQALGLNRKALLAIGSGDWRPAPVPETEGFLAAHSPFSDPYVVNAYVVWDPKTREAAVFDTGTQADPLVEALEGRGLEPSAVYLTHAHSDHVRGLSDLLRRFSCPVYASPRSRSLPVEARPVEEGFSAPLGRLRIRALETPGHTEDGLTFAVEGLERAFAVAGDALFAGSIGGPSHSYAASLDSLAKLLSLDPDTVLAPGHGPLTTVAEEREMNAFWTG